MHTAARPERQRAEAMRSYLVWDQGRPPEHLRIAAFGGDHPLAFNETTEGRDENRRVELVNLETKQRLLRDVRTRSGHLSEKGRQRGTCPRHRP
jgi:hypothetical protein